MTIDEAIAHEKELAKKSYLQGMLCHANPDDEKLDGYIESGKYHEQISELLEELKSYRSVGVPLLQYLHDDIRNDAIDDFAEKAIKIVYEANNRDRNPQPRDMVADIHYKLLDLAKQLKAGGDNEDNI